VDRAGYLGAPSAVFSSGLVSRLFPARVLAVAGVQAARNPTYPSCSVGDPDPEDPYVFGPPGSASVSHKYGSGSESGSGPEPSIIKQNSKKNLDFVTYLLFMTFYL
jgi:hypothetical protein